MNNLSAAEIIIAIGAFLVPSVITLVLGLIQYRNQKERGRTDDQLDLSAIAKNLSESWEKLTDDLRDEIKRIKDEADQRERKLIGDLENLQKQLDENQKRVDTVMHDEMIRAEELAEKLAQATMEKQDLQNQLDAIKDENVYLNAITERLKNENAELKQAMADMRKDIEKVQKKVTGDLKP